MIVKCTEADYHSLDNLGGCLACGEHQGGCEPDAENYECEGCGEFKVFGLEQLLLMGMLDITDLGPYDRPYK